MKASAKDRKVIRDLARRIAEIAELPIQAERTRLWKALNILKPERPMIVHNALGRGELEICPESSLRCKDENLRKLEWYMRFKISRHVWAHDDYPITNVYNVGWGEIYDSDFGVKESYTTSESGGFRWDPPIKKYSDINKLRPAKLEVNRKQSQQKLEFMQDLIGDILEVRRGGVERVRCKLSRQLIVLRGFEQFMIDLYEAPELVHELMSFLRDEMIRELEYYERENLFCLNNGPENWTNCGGMATNDELPGKEYDPNHVRMKNMYIWGESQESVGIGPEQFDEFILEYQLPILNRFGLVAYGCCEPPDNRLDLLINKIPKLRWVAVPTWSNRKLAAEKLQDKYVYSYKPQPSHITQPIPDWDAAEKEIRETLTIAKEWGCCVALDLKDAATFCGEIDRVTKWTDIAQRVVAEMA